MDKKDNTSTSLNEVMKERKKENNSFLSISDERKTFGSSKGSSIKNKNNNSNTKLPKL